MIQSAASMRRRSLPPRHGGAENVCRRRLLLTFIATLSSSSRWAASAPTASGGPSCRAADSWRAAASGTRWAWACPSGSSDTSPTRLCPGRWTASGTSTATPTARLPGSSWPSPSLRWRRAQWFEDLDLQFVDVCRPALMITLWNWIVMMGFQYSGFCSGLRFLFGCCLTCKNHQACVSERSSLILMVNVKNTDWTNFSIVAVYVHDQKN